jgi:FkbM family methyltransferase
VVLDVGANDGVAAVFFAGICQAGAVHCFEPVGPIYETLSRNIRSLANCTADPYRLARGSGTTTITYHPGAAAMFGSTPIPTGTRSSSVVASSILSTRRPTPVLWSATSS